MRHRYQANRRRRRGRTSTFLADASLIADAQTQSASDLAVRAERERILRWLHDSPLQTLEYLAAKGWGDGEHSDADGLSQVAALAADELRRFIEDQAEPTRHESFVDAVEEVVDEARRRRAQRIELVRGPTDGTSDGASREALAGALREALTNARKHSGAARVLVYCEEEDGRVVVTVRDDGVGAAQDELDGGFGVRHSIVERMRAVGGWAQLEEASGGGLVVMIGVDPAAMAA